MNKPDSTRIKLTLKTTVSRRLVYATSAIAIALIFGFGIFFFGNFNNNTKSFANNKKKEIDKETFHTSSNSGKPNAIKINCTKTFIFLSWNNNSSADNDASDGIIILRKQGLICDDQSIDDLEKNPSSLNGWSVIYNGSSISSFNDKNIAVGSYTYLIYEKHHSSKYTNAKDAARALVIYGKDIVEKVNADINLDGLFIDEESRLSFAENHVATFNKFAEVNIKGTVSISSQLNNDANVWVINPKAEFILNSSSNGKEVIPAASWKQGSTCVIKNISKLAPSGLNQKFENFIWNCASQLNDIEIADGLTVNGNLEIKSTGNKVLMLNGTNIINGNITIGNTAIVSTKNKSSVALTGNTLQNINGVISFENVSFNNKEGFN
ncbi:MAG: hypothetical protein LH629_05595, partial [Ignavibacteria bacterium]|nr:hypothetical protein [Ignavibacteria bacterium]